MSTETSFLFESAAGFEAVLENATVGLLVVDERGQIVYANAFSLDLFKYDRDELLMKSINILMPEPVRQAHSVYHVEYFKKPVARPMGIGQDLYARKKTGEIFPVEISLSPYVWNGCNMTIAFINDISVRKEKEETFRNLFENSLSGICTWNLKSSKPIDINEKGLDILGYKDKRSFFEDYSTQAHLVNLADEDFILNRLLTNGIIEHYELELYTREGKKIWILLFGRLNSARDTVNIVMIDITQRKLTSLKYQALFNNSLAGTYISDLKLFKIIDVNQKGVELLGYKSKEDFLQNYDQTFHYLNLADKERNIKMIKEKGDGELFVEQKMRRLDGTSFWARLFIKIDQKDNIIHTVLIDITESKQTHEELERIVKERTLELTTLLEREKELNDLKSRFVSMASHEFRTPLSTILSSAFLIESCNQPSFESERLKHVQRIRSSVKNLTDILNDFLSMDKLDQGKIDVFMKQFDLSEFAQEMVDEVSLMLKAGQHIELSFNGDKEVVQDKRILRNILLNLFSNAIKYSGENSNIYFSVLVQKEHVFIELRDEGMGIPEDEQKELFNRFFRASNAVNIQGTGLGLNIVKRYLDLLDGNIRFVSEVGVGTTFFLQLKNSR